jgi:hypothetical protein
LGVGASESSLCKERCGDVKDLISASLPKFFVNGSYSGVFDGAHGNLLAD